MLHLTYSSTFPPLKFAPCLPASISKGVFHPASTPVRCIPARPYPTRTSATSLAFSSFRSSYDRCALEGDARSVSMREMRRGIWVGGTLSAKPSVCWSQHATGTGNCHFSSDGRVGHVSMSYDDLHREARRRRVIRTPRTSRNNPVSLASRTERFASLSGFWPFGTTRI